MDLGSPDRSWYALAFETSGAVGGVAIGRGSDLLEARGFTAPLRHAREFLPIVESLCRTYDVKSEHIGTLHVSIGPGSFTGLRIGVAAARALALAVRGLGRPPMRITAVPTLEVIAQNALRLSPSPPHVAVVLDAKRGRVYAATFSLRANGYVPVDEPAEVEPNRYLKSCPTGTAVLGDGVPIHRAAIDAAGCLTLPEAVFAPRAETTFRLGTRRAEQRCFVEPRELIPLYIRPPEAEERWLLRNPNVHGDRNRA